MWLHKQNEYEWKNIGIWFEMASQELQKQIKASLPGEDYNQVFLVFKDYDSATAMVSENLCIRNKIASIPNNPELSKAEIKTQLEQIENTREQSIQDLEIKNPICVYLNAKDEFKQVLIEK